VTSRRPPVAAILFDLDETLLDNTSGRMERYREAFGRVAAATPGIEVDDLFRRYANLHRELANPYDRLQRVLDELSLDPAVREHATAAAFDPSRMRLHSGAIELLEDLRPRYRLGLVTNGPSGFQRAKLATFDLSRFFDGTAVISGEVGVAKPDPVIFELAAARVAARPGEIVFVGDDLMLDVMGAAAAGFTTVWIRGRAGHAADSPADFQVEHVTELPAVLLALEGER